MTSLTVKQRVINACEFKCPDQVPRVEFFWDYPQAWSQAMGPIERLNDVTIWSPREGTFVTRAHRIKVEDQNFYEVDQWGRLIRRKAGSYFVETIEAPINDPHGLDSLEFDLPDLDFRFLQLEIETIEGAQPFSGPPTLSKVEAALREVHQSGCLFGKIGGPFLRSAYLRGEAQFLIDIVNDPTFAKSLADKVADHLTQIGLQEIQRWSLQETGIWIFDDIAHNNGLLISPVSFEKILLPAYRCMVRTLKEAGARYIFFHSDGDIRLILDMLIDIGIDGINPVEPRARMRIPELRKKYPGLILTGGMNNTGTMISGPAERIKAETREILEVAIDGGVMIGSGYTGPDIPLENFLTYHCTCMTYGKK